VSLCLIISLATLWFCAFAGRAATLAHTNLLQFIAADGSLRAVRTTNDWAHRRTAILRAMEEVMGPLPGAAKRVPLDVQVEEEVDCGSYVRRLLTYQAEPGSRVPAYLLVPKRALAGEGTFGVLALHPTENKLGHKVVVGLGSRSNDHYAVELAMRGFVCLAPAYPLLANYQPDWRALGYRSGTMKAIWDNMRGIDLLETLPFIEPGRFGAIGHSLGGHNAIYTAVFDERVRAVASSCGFDSYRDYMDGNITGWTGDRYMPRLRAYAPDRYPFDFHELIAALAPRGLFVSAPKDDSNFKWRSVQAIERAARPVFALHGVPGNLRVAHPDCAHLFPDDMRARTYAFFEEVLKR
jgi:dienelactone hydrolase